MARYIEGIFSFDSGKGVLTTTDSEIVPLLGGCLMQRQDSSYGWTDGIYKEHEGFWHSRGTDRLEPGDSIRIRNER